MPAGEVHTILRPKIRVAALGSPLPNFADANGTNGIVYPAAWELVKRTGNGAQLTMNAAMQDITSDEVGVIGVVSAGTENVTVAFQTRTPSMKLIQYLAHMQRKHKAAVTGATPVNEMDIYHQDVGSQPFMIAIEGSYGAGGLTETGGKILALVYNGIQTENTQLVARTTGADAIVQPAATVRSLPAVMQASQIPAGAGVTLDDLNERFNMFVFPKAAA